MNRTSSQGTTAQGTIKAQLRCQHSEAFTLNVDITLRSRKTTAIFGPSGGGKTTLLRCLAGFSDCQGLIEVDGQCWQQGTHALPVHQRPLAYVFQEPSLFPHLSVEQNLRYAQKRATQRRTVASWQQVIALLGLEPLLKQWPEQLSGGERQRVAIARALLAQPSILLMDEPLASLDTERKGEVLKYLQALQQQFSLTLLYVTHSFDEIAQLADDLVVIEDGKVIAQGTVAEVSTNLTFAQRPYNQASSVIQGEVAEIDTHYQLVSIRSQCGIFWVRNSHCTIGEPIRLRLLASDISIARDKPSASTILNCLEATVTAIDHQIDQPMAYVSLSCSGIPLLAQITRKSLDTLQLADGQQVWAQIKSVAIAR